MIRDAQGNPVSGATAEAAQLFDQAIEAFNLYRGDPMALLDEAIAAAPAFAMAHILKAHLLALSTEPGGNGRSPRRRSSTLKRCTSPNARRRTSRRLIGSSPGKWEAAALALDFHHVELSARPRSAAGRASDGLLPRQRTRSAGSYRAGPAVVVARGAGYRSCSGFTPSVSRSPATMLAPRDRRRAVAMRATRLLGPPRGRPRDGDAGARRGRHRLDGRARAILDGRRQLLQGPQLVASRLVPPGPRSDGPGVGPLRWSDPRQPQSGRDGSGRRVGAVVAHQPFGA